MSEGLTGSGLLQSEEEWDERNRVLADNMHELINRYVVAELGRAIDVGCQRGVLTDMLARRTSYRWSGVDPALTGEDVSPSGVQLLPGRGNSLPFRDAMFDLGLFANVYEHVPPAERETSLREMHRVLRPGGVLVGQLPNPYFPIESHSRLPFMGWLPVPAQKAYWRLAPVPWEHDFFVVTIRDLQRTASRVGLETVLVRKFSYPLEVIPKAARWAAKLLERPLRHVPWAWQFVLRRPH